MQNLVAPQAYFNASIQQHFTIYQEQSLSFRSDAFEFPNPRGWNAPDTNFSGDASLFWGGGEYNG